jgi:hypothetical protein
MAFGDIGGIVAELILTCRTPSEGTVAIAKGDALKLIGPYEVTNATDADDTIFGQAMAATDANDAALPVLVRGVASFAYEGDAPVVNGAAGVLAAATDGKVKKPTSGNGVGINLKLDTVGSKVHVLL